MSDDWDSVTYLRKKAPTSKDNHSQAAINLAKRSGGDVRVEKKGIRSAPLLVYSPCFL